MAFADRINESIRGRNLGFEFLSSGKHGTTKTGKLLVGPEASRQYHTTGDTTGVNLAPFGVSVLDNSSAGSSQVFTLDPPIPGLDKTLVFMTSANTLYVKTANGETIVSSMASTFTVIKSTGTVAGMVKLTPVSTAKWVATPISSGSIAFAVST
jgi:hypothetical protein